MKWRLGAAALAASLACGAAQAGPYSAIYSFGDSLSDVGNVFAATGGAVPAPSFPSGAPAYFDGRFSNGRNWVDDLSAMLGLGPVLPSALGGNDFAWGGAQTGTTSASGTMLVPSLDDQVALFGHAVPSPKPGALYTLDIGGNDIGNALEAVAADPSFDLSAFLSEAIGNTVGAIGALYGDGARDVLYYETPDLSLVPDFKAGGALGGDLAMLFNEGVLAGIERLGDPGLTVFDVPVFGAIQTIVGDPARFGFTDVTSPCISGDSTSPGTECADPGSHLFWDGEHPTAAGHAITAGLAYRVLGVPEASTWAMLLIGFAGLGFARRRGTRARTVRGPRATA